MTALLKIVSNLRYRNIPITLYKVQNFPSGVTGHFVQNLVVKAKQNDQDFVRRDAQMFWILI